MTGDIFDDHFFIRPVRSAIFIIPHHIVTIPSMVIQSETASLPASMIPAFTSSICPVRSAVIIPTKIIANIVGLGWAATPPALKAMQELAKDNKGSKSASREMCVFLILNISSLQLIPVNIIAYRATYGSEHPTAIILPGIIATVCSTAVAVLLTVIINKRGK